MGEGETAIEGYLDSADTRSTPSRGQPPLGAEVERGRRGAAPIEPTLGSRGVGLRGARPGELRRRQRRHPAAPAAGLARRAAGGGWTLDGDESIRRRPVDRIVAPLRAMGARLGCREDGLPPLRDRGRRRFAASPTSCRWPAPRSSPACSSPGCSPRARRGVVEPLPKPRPHRADARGRGRRRSSAAGERLASPGGAWQPGRDRRSRRFLLGRLLARRGADRPGSESP